MRSARAAILLAWLIEIARVGWTLAFPGRHQVAVSAQVVGLVADAHEGIVLAAGLRDPGRTRIGLASRLLDRGPWPRQRVVEDRDLVVDDAGILLVEIDPL